MALTSLNPAAESVFRDLMGSTGPTAYGSADKLVNDAQRYNSYWTRFEHSGGSMSERIQAGPSIIARILLSVTRRARTYNPDKDTFQYRRSDVLDGWQIAWRHVFTYLPWTEHEIIKNVQGLSGKTRTVKYAEIKKVKEMDVFTDLIDFMESLALGVPNAASMESQDGEDPYSVFAFVNEFTNGLFPGFTTVQGIDPALKSGWRPVKQAYAELPKVGWDLFPALMMATARARWNEMPYKPELSTPDDDEELIGTTLKGLSNYEEGLRVNQDEFRGNHGPQDPHYGKPTFRGKPIMWFSAMDGLAIHPTGSAGAPSTEDDTTNNNAGARYFGFKNKFLRCVYHAERYMHKGEVMTPTEQPFARVLPYDTWVNRICTSRRRLWCVHPSATLT